MATKIINGVDWDSILGAIFNGGPAFLLTLATAFILIDNNVINLEGLDDLDLAIRAVVYGGTLTMIYNLIISGLKLDNIFRAAFDKTIGIFKR